MFTVWKLLDVAMINGVLPTCQVVSLGGAGEGAALLLPCLAAGERGLRCYEPRRTPDQL